MAQINKGRRHELKMLKYKKGLNLYDFRSPCKGQKYKRNKIIAYDYIDLSCESYKMPKFPPTFIISTPTDAEMVES